MGRYGHEFPEFEFSKGRLRYANNSKLVHTSTFLRLVWLSPLTISELKQIVAESEIIKEDDHNWPKKNVVGKQELEVRLTDTHISFETAKIGVLVDVQGSVEFHIPLKGMWISTFCSKECGFPQEKELVELVSIGGREPGELVFISGRELVFIGGRELDFIGGNGAGGAGFYWG
ncbi:hypothetical protein PSHT_11094 [Puccinia striiformis]|uniref:Uncharacterized protein n=1 Tax=Puccinia striiformis TaxID=27350 RepID=A0A2S4V5I1_9BASI|nr:hypothetical protein PSHT_11094 [Puccinia striiformis]